MTEVSSMSENEGRPSSLPPPPSERLPDLPTIFVSDTESGANHYKKTLDKNKRPKRKHNTVSGVTNEARKVLDVLLKRSLSGSDANPHQSDSSGGPPYEYPPHQYPITLPRNEKSYRHKITEKLLHEKMEQLELSLSESQDGGGLDEPDYVYPHEITRIGKPGTPQSSRSGSMRFTGSSRSHSPSDKILHQVHPLPPPQQHHYHHHHHTYGKGKHKYNKYVLEDDDDISSSSTEDYEYTDPNEFLRRKKKSFFRRATERLMHSFRRRKEHPLDFAEIDSPHGDGDLSPTHKAKKKKKGPSALSSPFKALSRKSSSSKLQQQQHYPGDSSAKCYNLERVDLTEHICLHQEVIRTGSVSPDNATHYTDIEQFHEESLRRKCQSPIPWKNSKFKQGHLSDGGKDKSILDNFIRQIKKRGSFKIKRKEPHKDGTKQRCHSAENLISVRPLSKEQEKLLQRYAHTKTHGTGSDSEILAVKSLHEVLSQRIDDQIEHPSPLLSNDDGHHLLREKMQLEELLRPAGKFKGENALFDEHDYDEIDDDIDAVDGMSFSSANCKPKPFADRTDGEKDMIYEKIAEQLAVIADHYNVTSAKSLKSSPTETFPPDLLLQESSGSSELEGAAARKPNKGLSRSESRKSKSSSEDDKSHLLRDPSNLEKELAAMLRDRGDSANSRLPDVTPVVKEMIRSVSYSKFKQIVNENIGAEPGWNQIAMMFRLTQTAVGLAGMGTAASLQIRENTLQYFEDRFANWIVDQGGWESVVEDTDKDSELD